ncbi:hypothetical protein BaRGS_00017371 [Batillaria attramentaria]|uniref:Uncharacterized protein n=1 Tax=Batillaria attramentaria TaxID=370345 RepID=A0ABD0KVS4_9CAEN
MKRAHSPYVRQFVNSSGEVYLSNPFFAVTTPVVTKTQGNIMTLRPQSHPSTKSVSVSVHHRTFIKESNRPFTDQRSTATPRHKSGHHCGQGSIRVLGNGSTALSLQLIKGTLYTQALGKSQSHKHAAHRFRIEPMVRAQRATVRTSYTPTAVSTRPRYCHSFPLIKGTLYAGEASATSVHVCLRSVRITKMYQRIEPSPQYTEPATQCCIH